MLLTIGIPIYKTTEQQISKLLQSIQQQNLESYEIIFLCDGTENEQKISFEYLRKVSHARVIVQKHSGEAEARNRIIKEADGKWLCFTDSDDYVLGGGINALINAAENNNADLVMSNHIRVYGNNIKSIAYFKCCRLIYNNESINAMSDILSIGTDQGTVWGKLFKTSFIKNNNLNFDATLKNGVDQEFMTRVILCQPIIAIIPDYTYAYVYNMQSVVRKFDEEYYKKVINTIKKIYKNLKIADMSKNIHINLSEVYVQYVFDRFLLILTNYICAGVKTNYQEKKKKFNQVRKITEFDEVFSKNSMSGTILHRFLFYLIKHNIFIILNLIVIIRNLIRFNKI